MSDSWPSYQPIYLVVWHHRVPFLILETAGFGCVFPCPASFPNGELPALSAPVPASKKDAAPSCLVKWHGRGGPSYGLSARQHWRRRTGRPFGTEGIGGVPGRGESKEEPGADVLGLSWNHFAGA